MKLNGNFFHRNKFTIMIIILLIVVFYISKTNVEGFQNNTDNIHYGDQIKIKFDIDNSYDGFNKKQIYLTCGNRNNKSLSLSNINASFSDDKMVYLDDNNNDLYQYWTVVGPNGTADNYKLNEPVKNSDPIRLQCVKNGANLYLSSDILSSSQKVLLNGDTNVKEKFTKNGNHDIVCHGEYNNTDDNANWSLKLDENNMWNKNSKFQLISRTGQSLLVDHNNENLVMITDKVNKYSSSKYNTGDYVFEKHTDLFNIDINNLDRVFNDVDLSSYEKGYKLINSEFSQRKYHGFLFNDGSLYPISKSDLESNKGNTPFSFYELKDINPKKTIVTTTENKNMLNMKVDDVRTNDKHRVTVYQNGMFDSSGKCEIMYFDKDKTIMTYQLKNMDVGSITIPKGYTAKLYSEYQPSSDTNKFVKTTKNDVIRDVVFFEGNHNDFAFSGIQGILIEKYCSGKVYERANYKGKMHCLDNGIHKLEKLGSWDISDNSDAKILTKYNDFEIKGDSSFKSVTNYRSISGANLDTSNTMILQPKGTDIKVFRNLGDLSSIKTMNVTRKNEEIPSVKQDNLKLALDFSNPRTYNSLKYGKVIRDISGMNNHIVLKQNSTVENGLLMDTTTNSGFGPSPINFNLNKGIQGYTIFLFAKRYVPSTKNTILNMSSDNENKGINIHFTYGDNIVYYDNATTNNERLLNQFSNEVLEQLNVYVFRKNADTKGGKLNMFLNGKLVKESINSANRLSLDKSKHTVFFDNFNGCVQSMLLYNTQLTDNEVYKVSHWQQQNYEKFSHKLNGLQKKLLSKVVPELNLYHNLKCIVNSKDKLSSAVDSDQFTDLSGLNNNFKFHEIPLKNNGRYENMKLKGKYLVGTLGSNLGIDKGTGYSIFMTVRLRSANNCYLFNMRGNNEPFNPKLNKYNRGISLFVENGNLTLIQGHQNKTIKENVNRISTPIKDYVGKTITIVVANIVDKATNKGKLEMYINNEQVSQGVSGTSAYVNLSAKPIIMCSSQDNINDTLMDGDLLSFVVYNKGLNTYQIEYISSYLMKGFYGSDVNVYGNKIDKHRNIPINSNFCSETVLDGHLYSNTECLDWDSKNDEGRYDNVLPNGAGWCSTNKDGTTRGYCMMDKDFKLVQSVRNDVVKTDDANNDKIKNDSLIEANRALVEKFSNIEGMVSDNRSQSKELVNEVTVETDFDFNGYNDYTDAVNKCISNKGRLCHAKEVTQGNGGTTNHNFYLNSDSFDEHPTYTKQQCHTLGLNYDESSKRCYGENIGETKLLPTVNINKSGEKEALWLPISLDNEGLQFMNIAKNDKGIKVGEINRDATQISQSGRKLLKCCDVGNTSLCEGNKTRLKLLEDDYADLGKQIADLKTNNANVVQIKMKEEQRNEIKLKMNKLQKKIWVECDKYNYHDALTTLKNYRKLYKQLVNEHERAKYNRSMIEKQMMKYIYYEDANNVKYVENDSIRSRKRKGMIPDLEQDMFKYKNMIKKELSRIENCPTSNPYLVDGVKPSCKTLATSEKPTEMSFAQQPIKVENKKCSPLDIKNYLMNSGILNKKMVNKLVQISSPMNLLKDKDIRQHKDFYKYVKSNKVNSCPKTDENSKIVIKQKTIKDFDIKNHPEHDKYVRLDTIPRHRVPDKYMEQWKLLKGF